YRKVMVVGCNDDPVNGRVTDPSLWQIDDPPEGGFILLVDGVAQVCKQVFDFLALVERKATNDFVFDIHSSQRLFNGARLTVGAIQYCEVAELELMLHLLFEDR